MAALCRDAATEAGFIGRAAVMNLTVQSALLLLSTLCASAQPAKAEPTILVKGSVLEL